MARETHSHLLDDEISVKSDRQVLFVCEGPDGCGKTHIAHELSQRLHVPYFKNEGEWAHFEKDDDYFVNCMRYGDLGMLTQFLKQTGHSAIMDRSWPSEMVYSKVFGRETDHGVLKRLDAEYCELGCRMIVCLRESYEGIRDQFESITTERLTEIHDAYLEFCDWTTCPVLKLWVDDEDLDRELDEIMNFIA